MRTQVIASLAALVLAGASLPALAETTKPMDSNKDGKVTGKERRDTNRDGKLTQAEKDNARARYERQFREADRNNDGGLSREELRNSKTFRGIEKNFAAMDTD